MGAALWLQAAAAPLWMGWDARTRVTALALEIGAALAVYAAALRVFGLRARALRA